MAYNQCSTVLLPDNPRRGHSFSTTNQAITAVKPETPANKGNMLKKALDNRLNRLPSKRDQALQYQLSNATAARKRKAPFDVTLALGNKHCLVRRFTISDVGVSYHQSRLPSACGAGANDIDDEMTWYDRLFGDGPFVLYPHGREITPTPMNNAAECLPTAGTGLGAETPARGADANHPAKTSRRKSLQQHPLTDTASSGLGGTPPGNAEVSVSLPATNSGCTEDSLQQHEPHSPTAHGPAVGRLYPLPASTLSEPRATATTHHLAVLGACERDLQPGISTAPSVALSTPSVDSKEYGHSGHRLFHDHNLPEATNTWQEFPSEPTIITPAPRVDGITGLKYEEQSMDEIAGPLSSIGTDSAGSNSPSPSSQYTCYSASLSPYTSISSPGVAMSSHNLQMPDTFLFGEANDGTLWVYIQSQIIKITWPDKFVNIYAIHKLLFPKMKHRDHYWKLNMQGLTLPQPFFNNSNVWVTWDTMLRLTSAWGVAHIVRRLNFVVECKVAGRPLTKFLCPQCGPFELSASEPSNIMRHFRRTHDYDQDLFVQCAECSRVHISADGAHNCDHVISNTRFTASKSSGRLAS